MKRLLLFILLACGPVAAQTTPTAPTAPTAVSLPLSGGGLASTYSIDLDTTGYVTHSVNPVTTAAELTTALAAADCSTDGYFINLMPGTFIGNFIMADKSCAAGKYVFLRSSDLGACPTDGTRIDDTYTGSIPKITANSNASGLQIEDSADNLIVRCIEFDESITTYTAPFINVGDAIYTATNQVPANIILDQILIRGAGCGECRRGISLNGANVAVINSYIAGMHQAIPDTQAIGSWCTQGPLLIDNNFAEGAGENIFVGGGSFCGLPTPTVTSDVTITRNHLYKDPAWESGDPWSVKNNLEFKGGKRFLVSGNLVENCWHSAIHNQVHCMAMKATNQEDDTPWQEISDFEFSYNKCLNCKGSFLVIASSPEGFDAVGFTGRALVKENLAFVGSAATYSSPSLIYVINTWQDAPADNDGNRMEDINITHNTFIPLVTTPAMMRWSVELPTGITPLPNYAFHSNIMGENATSDIHQDCFNYNGAPGTFTGATCTTSANAYNNIVYNNSSDDCTDDFYGPNAASCPVANLAAVGLVNTAGGDYRCDTGSICKNAGLDGEDVGLTALGYEIMECLTGIALSGVSADCSIAAPPTSLSVSPGVTLGRGVTIQ